MTTYVFDHRWQRERQRLEGLEEVFDAASRRHLLERGVGSGWRCLEVGCGAGGIARWLADQVGPSGQVVATDLDPRFLDGHGRANLSVRQHDLSVDRLEPEAFDLAHARAVLQYVPQPDRALATLVGALRPGGWLVIEDVDFGPSAVSTLVSYVEPPEHAALMRRVYDAVGVAFSRSGASPSFGQPAASSTRRRWFAGCRGRAAPPGATG